MAGKLGFPFFYPEPVTHPRRQQRYAGTYATVNCHHALPLTENSSAHPTSGGPYYWAAMLSPRKRAPLASWITGDDLLEPCSCQNVVSDHDGRLVQPFGPSSGNDWNQVPTFRQRVVTYLMNSNYPSFACATFISTACTLKTNFVPTPKTTIGGFVSIRNAIPTNDLCCHSRYLCRGDLQSRIDQYFWCTFTSLSQ